MSCRTETETVSRMEKAGPFDYCCSHHSEVKVWQIIQRCGTTINYIYCHRAPVDFLPLTGSIQRQVSAQKWGRSPDYSCRRLMTILVTVINTGHVNRLYLPRWQMQNSTRCLHTQTTRVSLTTQQLLQARLGHPSCDRQRILNIFVVLKYQSVSQPSQSVY